MSEAFKEVLLEQVIIIVRKQNPKVRDKVSIVSNLYSPNQTISYIEQGQLEEKNTINFSSDDDEQSIARKMNQSAILLGEISENFRGIGAQKDISQKTPDSERILSGKEVQRFFITNYRNYFITKNNVETYKKATKLRQPKIMCQNIVAHIPDHIKITATYDDTGLLNLDTVNNIVLKSNSKFLPKYVLALLNSKLISYFTYNFIYSKAIRTMHFDGNYSGKIPIKDIPIEKQLLFQEITDKLISLNLRLKETGFKKTDETQRIRDEINQIEKNLDSKIYELYGLDKTDIEIVEKSYA